MASRNCLYSNIGCQFQGSGEVIWNHEQDKSFHLVAAVIRCESQKNELIMLNEQVKQGEEEASKWRKESAKWMLEYFKMKNANDALLEEINKFRIRSGIAVEIEARNKEVVESAINNRKADEEMVMGTNTLSQTEAEFSRRNKDVIKDFNELKMKTAKCQAELEARLEKKVKDHLAAFEENNKSQFELALILKRQKEELIANSIEIANLKSALEKLSEFVSGRQCWTIHNVTKLLSDFSSGKRTSLFGDPFYSKPNGLKFCLRLTGTHHDMGIELCLLKNETELQHPVKYTAKLRLLDQMDSNFHVERNFVFKIKKDRMGIIFIQESYLSIPHYQLKNDIYMVTDMIRVEIKLNET